MKESEGMNKEIKERKRGRCREVDRTGIQCGAQGTKPQDYREDSEQRKDRK